MISTYIADLKDEEAVAFTRKNSDGTYTIILNGRYNDERLKEAYEHELRHIENGDLDEVVSIQEAELIVRKIKEKEEPMIFGMPAKDYHDLCRKAAVMRRKKLLAKYYRERKRGERPYWERT